jgi:serine-type D-Ala-D-Ala carboxypeptidase (penicillin-binding protein 5/6)
MGRRILAVILVLLAVCIASTTIILAYTSFGQQMLSSAGITLSTTTPSPTPIPYTPTPTPTPKPILTVKGKPPTVQATAAYLVDMDTGSVLVDINGEKPLPMASTTKIMTALIAIQTADLNQLLTVQQSDIDHALLNDGSNAGLRANDQLTLKDLLYALLLPSGDDAATTIARELGGGSVANFVTRMNLFAYRLHLFQTHYSNPDGLTLDTDGPHYTTAADLTRLTRYALSIPLFAQIVKTPTYTVAATSHNQSYTWSNTNTLLTTYNGMDGVKTGHTFAAGYCLVFAATRNGHHLLGVVLNSPNQDQRDKDATTLLNWGFALPVLPPTY